DGHQHDGGEAPGVRHRGLLRGDRRQLSRLLAALVFPENFLFTESINILAMVILGGMGNLLGVVAGAALLVSLPEVFRDLQRYRLLAFGLMLMVLMVFRPQGLLSFERKESSDD